MYRKTENQTNATKMAATGGALDEERKVWKKEEEKIKTAIKTTRIKWEEARTISKD